MSSTSPTTTTTTNVDTHTNHRHPFAETHSPLSSSIIPMPPSTSPCISMSTSIATISDTNNSNNSLMHASSLNCIASYPPTPVSLASISPPSPPTTDPLRIPTPTPAISHNANRTSRREIAREWSVHASLSLLHVFRIISTTKMTTSEGKHVLVLRVLFHLTLATNRRIMVICIPLPRAFVLVRILMYSVRPLWLPAG